MAMRTAILYPDTSLVIPFSAQLGGLATVKINAVFNIIVYVLDSFGNEQYTNENFSKVSRNVRELKIALDPEAKWSLTIKNPSQKIRTVKFDICL